VKRLRLLGDVGEGMVLGTNAQWLQKHVKEGEEKVEHLEGAKKNKNIRHYKNIGIQWREARYRHRLQEKVIRIKPI
jgi:hypothetical protein